MDFFYMSSTCLFNCHTKSSVNDMICLCMDVTRGGRGLNAVTRGSQAVIDVSCSCMVVTGVGAELQAMTGTGIDWD